MAVLMIKLTTINEVYSVKSPFTAYPPFPFVGISQWYCWT